MTRTSYKKRHKVKLAKPENVTPFSYIVGEYENLTCIKAVLRVTDDYTIFETEHGKLVVETDKAMKVKDGDIYSGRSGSSISEFFNDLIALRSNMDENLECVANGVILTIRAEDDLNSVIADFEMLKDAIASGEYEEYKF